MIIPAKMQVLFSTFLHKKFCAAVEKSRGRKPEQRWLRRRRECVVKTEQNGFLPCWVETTFIQIRRRVADARRHGVGALILVVTPDPPNFERKLFLAKLFLTKKPIRGGVLSVSLLRFYGIFAINLQ